MSPHIFKQGPSSNKIGCFKNIFFVSEHKNLTSFSERFISFPGRSLSILLNIYIYFLDVNSLVSISSILNSGFLVVDLFPDKSIFGFASIESLSVIVFNL